jgi:tetratricopeptide (TPR) repeat protein
MHLRLASALLLASLVSCSDKATSPVPITVQSIEQGLDAKAAYERGVALQRAGHHIESVPFFRRAMQAHQEISRLHLEYGEALHNAAIQTDQRFGFVRFVVPSSQERAALANEAILELRRSAELARTADERAYALFILGRTQSLIGIQADALESVMMAQALAPNVSVLGGFELSQRLILMDEE